MNNSNTKRKQLTCPTNTGAVIQQMFSEYLPTACVAQDTCISPMNESNEDPRLSGVYFLDSK